MSLKLDNHKQVWQGVGQHKYKVISWSCNKPLQNYYRTPIHDTHTHTHTRRTCVLCLCTLILVRAKSYGELLHKLLLQLQQTSVVWCRYMHTSTFVYQQAEYCSMKVLLGIAGNLTLLNLTVCATPSSLSPFTNHWECPMCPLYECFGTNGAPYQASIYWGGGGSFSPKHSSFPSNTFPNCNLK